MKIKQARFHISSSNQKSCPNDKKAEFAFIGRSNVGKSSLINMLTNHSKLAKTSAKPGKTSLINHFLINDSWYLVDLPGYGWSKVSKEQKAEWGVMIEDYLLHRENLCTVFVLVDSRLEPQEIDINFINWLGEKGIPFGIILTKTDKLTKNKFNQSVQLFQNELAKSWEELPPMFTSSSVSKEGKTDILSYIGEVIDFI